MKILDYIKAGERKGYNMRPTCASREPHRAWFNLGENIADSIAFPERVRLRHIVFYNPNKVSLNKNLYGIEVHKKKLSRLVAIGLNSTLTVLYSELFARQPGGGGGPLDIDVNVAADVLLPKLSFLEKYKGRIISSSPLNRTIENIFSELGAFTPEEVSLDKVKIDRRELDKIIMGEILGLTDEEQIEAYRAVVDLVKSRIEKAKSTGKNKKIIDGVDVVALKNTVVERIKKES